MAGGKRVSSKDMKAGAYSDPADRPSVQKVLRPGLTRWLIAIPLPVLVVALLVNVISVDIDAAVALLGAVALQLGGVALIRRGLHIRNGSDLDAALNNPTPVIGAGAIALLGALFLAALVGFQGLIQPIGVTVLGAIGLWLGLFTVTGEARKGPAKVAGIDMADLRRQLSEGHDYVKRMRAGGAKLSSKDDQAQVTRIADQAEAVLEGILADPSDLRRARRFLATYLERATTSVEKFVVAENSDHADPLRADFNATLDVIETAFTEQQQRLNAEDQIDLEVQLDVLRKQMEREGL